MKNQNYFLGLDIGTNSVGYAVTDESYSLIKFKGEPLWGTTLFDEASQSSERRSFRTARRRLDRRQQRVLLTQEIFAEEIAKIDSSFFIRISQSALLRCDATNEDKYAYFNDIKYTDKNFHCEYPTIHHLICELIASPESHDVRLVYLAVAWLMAHRGHFLNEVDKSNVAKLLDFNEVYDSLMVCFEIAPWCCDTKLFQEVLKRKIGVTKKEKAFFELLYSGKKPKDSDDDYCSKTLLIKLLCGGKVSPEKLFGKEEYSELPSFSLSMPDDEFSNLLALLGDDAAVVEKLRAVFDWALLADILSGSNTISEAKVAVYRQHQTDLCNLKKFVKKYAREKYAAIFRRSGESNYVAYSYNEKSLKNGERCKKKASKEVFCDYLKKELKGISPEPCDAQFYSDMMDRLDAYSFMPKQVNSDNRVIPYQLYWHELNAILKNAQKYLPFLSEKDADGFSNIDKLLAVFEFRVPYYVGPLRKDNSANAWIVRKASGKIYPWNFENKVDLDLSEQAFIDRMTNTCSYIPGEDVVAKNSLIYSRFCILNEINKLRINDKEITVEVKQKIFSLFETYPKVSVKKIRDFLISGGYMKKTDLLSGIDETIKSSYKPYHDFKRFLIEGILSTSEVEKIIARLTYCEEKSRIRKYLEKTYATLSADDIAYISKLKYGDFGNLSVRFLNDFPFICKETGEVLTVIDALWQTNDNLMQLMSDKYTLIDEIEQNKKDYYAEHPAGIDALLDEMYISNAVKRPIYRTLDIVKDIKSAMGTAPKKIFIEMARGGGEKGKRTKTRRSQIEELYKNCDINEVRALSVELEGTSDNELQSEKLFLYFMQLGKSMYSGQPLDIKKMKTDEYNVDHIYPQSRVKDDSIANKVLVLSTENGAKGDSYPIDSQCREKMTAFWQMLLKSGLISEEKFKRLTRSTGFTDTEKQEFINRQLVETRQSTKAVATLLGDLFPDTEIIYVKAGLVSDFRHEFDMVKSRQINDLHHAKDAYLNIVCGNVYNSRFTKRFFSVRDDYTLKTKKIFTNPVFFGSTVVWQGEPSLAKIRTVMKKNNIHFTRYAFMRKGGLFDQMPVKAATGLVERKKGLDTSKYGGYNKPTASCFMIVKYEIKGNADVMIVPVELMNVEEVSDNEDRAKEYLRAVIAGIENKPVSDVTVISLPLGLRRLKINTLLSIDGYRACITGKASGGKQVILTSMVPLIFDSTWEQYIKRLESFAAKMSENKNIVLNEAYDKISREKNLELYDWFEQKLNNRPYSLAVFSNQYTALHDGREQFISLETGKQVVLLLNILLLFKTCRAGGCDLTSIGGVGKAGAYLLSTKLSNWKKYSDVRIIDSSASGIHEKTSQNILELL